MTNHELSFRAGTQLYLRDLSQALVRLGHLPMIYSPQLGAVAEEIRSFGVPVVSDLHKIREVPDLIHGQHHLPTMCASLHFPKTPILFFCHGFLPWLEAPLPFSRVLRYVAVDLACRERLVSENGISPEKIDVILNFADRTRFQRRRSPLPERPKRAALMNNLSLENGPSKILREACEACGISLEIFGLNSGRALEKPEEVLPEFDLVFAKGRAAIEALMVGAAVIPYNDTGFGAMVNEANLSEHLSRNLGFTLMTKRVTVENLKQEIELYNREASEKVCSLVQERCSMDRAVAEVITAYEKTLEDRQKQPARDTEKEAREISDYLAFLSDEVLSQSRYAFRSQLAKREAEVSVLLERQDLVEEKLTRLSIDKSLADQKVVQLTELLRAVENSATMQIKKRLEKLPLLRGVFRRARELLRRTRQVSQ